MDYETAVRQIQMDLRNFPEEIIREWLAQCAPRLGWPPSPQPQILPMGPWAGVLLQKPLSFWQRVEWVREQRALPFDILNPASVQLIQDLINAYVHGKLNQHSLIKGGKERFQSALIYLQDHGVFPKAISVIEEGCYLAVADGFHRVTAYFAYDVMLREPSLRASLPSSAVALSPLQPMWVGRAFR